MPRIPPVGIGVNARLRTPDIGDYIGDTFGDEGANVHEFNTMQTFRNNLHETNLSEEEQAFMHDKIRALQTHLAKKIYEKLVDYDFSEQLESIGGKSAKRSRKKINKHKRITRKNK